MRDGIGTGRDDNRTPDCQHGPIAAIPPRVFQPVFLCALRRDASNRQVHAADLALLPGLALPKTPRAFGSKASSGMSRLRGASTGLQEPGHETVGAGVKPNSKW